jgi:acyl-CoA oxidase
LRALASDEQIKQYLERAQKYQVIGCYAQTELSHGSNVAGLGTTATFIKETDEFEFHTPNPEACKWWVGQLGRLANHAGSLPDYLWFTFPSLFSH